MLTNRNNYGAEIQYLIDNVPAREMLELLAEEAAELSQAAIKMIRCIYTQQTNPTPTTEAEAMNNLIEELSDINLLWYMLGLEKPVKAVENPKARRWKERIENAQ